ncbi:GGDEF domain-containing protein [Marinimicrobium sp. C2-29]|uniref:GGDEF domain-containing protein n=1 Tax=Marinimicrobium sp. C2-29 TaxID=3139825 RepID=UPI003139C428
MEQLLKDFGGAALEIAPGLRGGDSRTLEDHAREMLEFITEDLLTPQTNRESAIKALGKGRSPVSNAASNHGSGRHSQGLSMVQMIQELRALRARIMQAWGDSQKGLSTDDIDELLRFNEAIDQLIVNSVASYTTLKEQDAHLFEAMLRVSPDPSAIFDPSGKLLFLNAPMADLAKTTARDAAGKTPRELNLGFASKLQDAITVTVRTGQLQRREFRYPSLSGQELYFDCQLVPVFDDWGKIKAVAKTSRDITERKQAERQIWHSANYDSLTGIPNRRLFLDRLEQSVLEATRQDREFALIFIDLDLFKQANDKLGHSAGDRLLEQVAERISTGVRAMDTVARLGGDEFTLIFKDINRGDAKEAAEELLANLERPFKLDTQQVHLSGSVGVAMFPDDGKDVEELMHNADQAMYAAKERGGHQVQLHQSEVEQSHFFTEL